MSVNDLYEGQSTANFATYGTSAPTHATTFTEIKDSSDYLCSRIPNRAKIHSVECLVSHASSPITETTVTVTICRGVNGEWPVLVLAVPITVVGSQTKAAGHKAAPDTPRRYVNMGLSGESARNGVYSASTNVTSDSNVLYGHVYGAIGGFDCRLIVHWESF